MARTIRLALRMICRTDALAKVIAAAANANQMKIPHADGQLRFFFLLQEGNQLGDEVWEDVSNKGWSGSM